MARGVMDQLIATGKVRRGQLGIGIQPLTPDQAASLRRKDAGGVGVATVAPQSPAARAGLRPGDAIVALEGEPVRDGNTLRNRIASTPPGTKVTLTIIRQGEEQQIEATLGEYTPPKRAG
jgi:S1-C subfamily serine protease